MSDRVSQLQPSGLPITHVVEQEGYTKINNRTRYVAPKEEQLTQSWGLLHQALSWGQSTGCLNSSRLVREHNAAHSRRPFQVLTS